MTTRTCPWQYEWKRPQWSAVERKTPEEKQQSRIKGTPLGVTSAQLSPSEALSLGIQHDDSLVLTITLYDSFQHHRGQGDVLLLELLSMTPADQVGRFVCIKDRILHWPGLAVHKQGLSSISLARQPQPRTATHPPTIDALDVLNRMSLGAMTITGEHQYEQPTDECELSSSSSSEAPMTLLLSCLTTDGQVYFYEPLTFLEDRKVQDDAIGMGFADLLLGGIIHRHIQDSIFPLSQPTAVTRLSVPLHHVKQKQRTHENKGLFAFFHNNNKESTNDDNQVWDSTMWDANVEPSTTMYRTVENKLFRVEPVFEYLAVLGKGRRVQRAPVVLAQKVESVSTLSSLGDVEQADDSNNSNSNNERHDKEQENCENGGFIAFLSMTHFTETRTVYLPFAPKSVYPIVWGEMSFVLVLEEGGPRAMAIRVDASQLYSVPCGGIPVARKHTHDNTDTPTMCPIPRFHLIPVLLPIEDALSLTTVQTMAASSMLATPPSVAVMYASRHSAAVDVAVTLCTLDHVNLVDGLFQKDTLSVVIRTKEQSGHTGRIPNPVQASALTQAWCRIGQGWSLVGIGQCVYFICWEGAMASSGAHVSQVFTSGTPLASAGLDSVVLPLCPFRTYESRFVSSMYEETKDAVNLHLPFTSPYKMPTPFMERANSNFDVDHIVVNALDSISNLSFRDTDTMASPGSPSRRRSTLTANEKSVRLLEHCKGWTMLDDEQTLLNGRIPVVLARLGESQQIGVLSLRNIVVRNGGATPFHYVLAWLSHEQDYFTAASIALSLLRDVDSLRDLRKLSQDIDYDPDRTNLEGLLDGIRPLFQKSSNSGHPLLLPPQSILTQVADMTLGCLVKGGLSMVAPMKSFVLRNRNYDPARACLMLVAVATRCVSGDLATVNAAMGLGYNYEPDSADPADILWAVNVLLQVGVARDYMGPVLFMLNATIPDELRRRRRGGNATDPFPPMDLCKALVSVIIESSPEAPTLLLSLVDEVSRKRFWPSLDHKTQLEYSLISIDAKRPLFRQAEVRTWAVERLQECIEKENSSIALEILPTDWLKDLTIACLCNAGCNFELYCFDQQEPPSDMLEEADGAKRHAEEVKASYFCMVAGAALGGLDFNLLIPALLLLEHRGVRWHEDSTLTTQTMLNSACNLAGRHSKEEPLFTFDSPTLMRQCGLIGNVLAGAHLVGGVDGLVLKCCDILMKGAGIDMDEAEAFVVDDILHGAMDSNSTSFELTDEHRKILWLIDEHVLCVRTFGEFSPTSARGKIDPVFAARACLRTWLRLSCSVESSDWLVAWFRRRLGIAVGGVSHKRLACAALVRTLMWPTVDDPTKEVEADSDQLLANALRIESLFLVQLCRSCCGLVEAVPPSMAEDIIRQSEAAVKVKPSTTSHLRLDVGLRGFSQ